MNWPQNDFFGGNLIDVDEKVVAKTLADSRSMNLSFFYWLQTEVPRPDGGTGWPGLRLRGDVMGTEDGMAKYPYIRESRRIAAEFTVLEEHVGKENRKMVAGEKEGATAPDFPDSVGTGYYHIDLRPSNPGRQLHRLRIPPFPDPPRGAPAGARGEFAPGQQEHRHDPHHQRLLPAPSGGVEHRGSGGQAGGVFPAEKVPPKAVRARPALLGEFQDWIRTQGLETHWPS